MTGRRILVVEDDPATAAALEVALTGAGYRVTTAADGEEGLRRLDESPPDLLVLDLMLPKRDGLSVLSALRKERRSLPVLILSARDTEREKVEGLRAGADDYLVKPFGLDELLARIEALFRRTLGLGETLRLGDVVLDLDEARVLRDGEMIPLSPKEHDLLLYLIRNRNHVLSRERILEAVWGSLDVSDLRAVDFHVLNLRKKIERNPKKPRHLVTRRGLGFQFVGDDR